MQPWLNVHDIIKTILLHKRIDGEMIGGNGTGRTVPNQYVTPFRFSLVVSFDLITYAPLR